MNQKEMQNTSKFISLILRHKPETIGLCLDEHGWADVKELLNGINNHSDYKINMAILEQIVDEDSKQRYSFNEDKSLLRANQGHSIPVDVELREAVPPEVLYHGTGVKYQKSIEAEGLVKKSRLYVHLSDNQTTAFQVGKRHGQPVVYGIDAGKMYKDGYKFYQSVNNVWLTGHVPIEYMVQLQNL